MLADIVAVIGASFSLNKLIDAKFCCLTDLRFLVEFVSLKEKILASKPLFLQHFRYNGYCIW